VATLKTIAQAAGVSINTASIVLNGRNGKIAVSEATRRKINEVAEQMDYRPNGVARSLRRKYTNIIGVYYASGVGHAYLNARTPFFADLICGLQEGCYQNHKDLLMHSVYPDRPTEQVYSELLDGRIDGLIVFAKAADPLMARLATSRLPVVAVGDLIPVLPSVFVDGVTGARLLANHLVAKGHTRVLYRSWSLYLPSVQLRQEAFFARARELNLAIEEWKTVEVTDPEDASVAPWLNLPRGERPTAAVCWNDNSAYDLLAICEKRGIKVPDELAVCGFDDVPATNGVTRRLTTIHGPATEIGFKGIELLMARMQGKTVPMETLIPVSLVIGDTT